MIELYDNPVSTSAQKVRLTLHEKGQEFKSHMLNLQAGDQFDPEFLKINPKGQVPALVHDGNVITESNVIIEYIDEVFPEPPLKPADPLARSVMRSWVLQTESWCITHINNINVGLVFRPIIMGNKTPEELKKHIASVPNPTTRMRHKELFDKGVDAPQFANAIERYYMLMGQIDDHLKSNGPWLAGEHFSLADIAIFPYVHRLHDIGWEKLWKGRDNYVDWHERFMARPAYKAAIDDIVPPQAIEMAQKFYNENKQKIDKILSAL